MLPRPVRTPSESAFDLTALRSAKKERSSPQPTAARLLDSRDATDFRRRTEQLFAVTIAPERSTNRLDRIEAIGATKGRPRLIARIAHAQKNGTDEHAGLLREFQQRGWMRADIDPAVLSVFTQAVILGRVLDDVSEDSIDLELWHQTVMHAINSLNSPS